MVDSKTRNALLGGLVAGCLVGSCFGGAVVGLVIMRPEPDPTADCRTAIQAMAGDMGETLSSYELEDAVTDCMEDITEDEESAALVECIVDAKNADAREACMSGGSAGKRSRRAEAPTNVDAIRTAEKAYHAEWDAFTSADWTPPQMGGTSQVAFTGGGFYAFENLGWTADGKIRCRYRTTAKNASSSGDDDFLIESECDIDGDGRISRYTANRAEKATMISSNDVY